MAIFLGLPMDGPGLVTPDVHGRAAPISAQPFRATREADIVDATRTKAAGEEISMTSSIVRAASRRRFLNISRQVRFWQPVRRPGWP
jgi:hypothetical protein